jgi:hypothetical protein
MIPYFSGPRYLATKMPITSPPNKLINLPAIAHEILLMAFF